MLERILAFSVERRWLVVLLAIAAAAVGIESALRLPIDAVPDITNNQVQINTVQPALGPVEIEKQVTVVVETALAGIPGLSYTRSLSRNGFSQVTAVFDDAIDLYFARQQVAERLAGAREALPAGAEPALGPISTGLGEISMWTVGYAHPGGVGASPNDGLPGWQRDGTYLTPEGERLTSELERAAYLRTVQDWIIRPQIKTVAGVAGVDVIGGYVKQILVEPDPRRLVAYGVTFHDLIEALERNNVSVGAGYVERAGESYVVRATGRIEHPDEIASIVVGERHGTPISVREVASVGTGRELRTGAGGENGREAVVGTALMLIGANSRTVAEAVGRRIEEIRRTLPADVVVTVVLDRSRLVDATIHTVAKSLVEGAALVVVVLFVMLGNFRAALVTALAIPLSMLLTAIGMVQSHTSGNLMSLGAIDFGLIVDGAVILVENSLRRLGEAQQRAGNRLELRERLRTVYEASAQVLTPAASGVGIILIVYVPILFLTGIEGKMFRPMAITVILALLSAFVLSLTLVPALVAITVTGPVRAHGGALATRALAFYRSWLLFSLGHRPAVVGAAVASLLVATVLFGRLGQEFVPTLDELDLAIQAVRIPSTSLTESRRMQQSLEHALAAVPEVARVFSKTGTAELAADPMPPSASDNFVMLKPRAEWPDPRASKEDVRRRIEAAAARVPGQAYEFTQPIAMRFNELIAGVRGDVAVKVFGDEIETLAPVAARIADVLRDVRGAADVRVEQAEGLPVLTVDTDRRAVAGHGLAVADVQEVVSIAVGGRVAGQLFQGDRRFDIVVRLPEEFRADPERLDDLPIPLRVASASTVPTASEASERRFLYLPLGAVARIDAIEGPNQVSRENGKRRIVVQTNVRGRDLGSFVEEAERRIAETVALPPGTWLGWGGQFENVVAAKARLAWVVPACFLLILVLLYGSLGSVTHAMLVFTGVPLALSGGIVSLWLRGMPFSISAAVGLIALSGVAVLNGLVMVTFIEELRRAGHTPRDAILDGATSRLRPVLMTALVASLGFVPMALATGTGAEVQRPLATVVIGGLVTSTLLTLVVLPTLFDWVLDSRRGPGA